MSWRHTGENFLVNWKIVKKNRGKTWAVILDRTKEYVHEEFGNLYQLR